MALFEHNSQNTQGNVQGQIRSKQARMNLRSAREEGRWSGHHKRVQAVGPGCACANRAPTIQRTDALERTG